MKNCVFFLGVVLNFLPHWAYGASCKVEETTLADGDFKVEVLRYTADGRAGRTLLIIPPTGGTNFLDKNYAKSFCKEGFDVYVLSHWSNDSEKAFDLEIHDRFYSRAQKAVGAVLKHVSSPWVGILGTSVGGLHTAVAMAQHSRLDAAFVIAGGAPIAEVIVDSDQDAMMEAKTERYKIYKFKSDAEYLAALKKLIPLDPMNFPAPVGKDLGVMIATLDTTVPTKNQQDLINFWKPQKVITFENIHLFGIVKTWLFHKNEIIEFFKRSAARKN